MPPTPGERFEQALHCRQQGDFEAAATLLEALIAEFPQAVQLWDALGLTRCQAGQHEAGHQAFAQALHLQPRRALTWNNRGVCYLEAFALAEAEACFRQALQADPDLPEAQANLAQVLRTQGHTRAALKILPPHSARQRWQQALSLPPIYATQAELTYWRAHYQHSLQALAADPPRVRDPWQEIGILPFYLGYQGHNDRALQEQLAQILLAACPGLRYDARHCQAYRGPRGKRLRIGFASSHLSGHTIATLFSQMLIAWDQTRFEKIAIFFEQGQATAAAELRAGCEAHTVLAPDFFRARAQLAELELDILCWLDLGMDPRSWFLAFARLAPLQAVTWGHPLTTGLPALDLFISNRVLEPVHAASHYSEQLIQLQHLHPVYPRPQAPAIPRSAWGLPEQQPLLFCPQSLFKLHPEFDTLLAEILTALPTARLLLPAAPVPQWQDSLRARWQGNLPLERIVFVPRLPPAEFRALMQAVDVVLDPLHFGGGNTSYEALGLGVPLVTLPGPLLRGRFSAGFYQTLGVTEWIAHTPADYVQHVVTLAQDPAQRAHCRQQLQARQAALYDCQAGLRELEQVLINTLQERYSA